ncbi:DNA polymerase III subunit gamma and tau [Gordonia amarae]|uniref:DNA polymerase III subunit gamma and tau n=1 Tax=Gordonia amarae TaxID=36821 RepID=UPI001AFC8B0B|nr:DNA polymerase III subunit gamma and tau [Gordonia amarae]QHN32655.1 DNA polymerase III subunit gamma and tau [Gordonia amarae]
MALYRTYRPATFAEVVGQEHVTDPLSRALDSGRINHAYLFSGPRGCGKTSSARILARSLNCAQGPTSTPCGTCSSCVALRPGGPGNLDVIELDAASHGGVDDTRELRDRAFYAPSESRYRVFIVDEAHMVTNAGFNALLKIVEEPPEHLIFVFATTEPEKVLPTIRSRTHHYPFRLLAPPVMRGLLENICAKEHVTVAPDVYPLVIRAGGGSPRDSLSILDQLLAGAGEDGVTYDRALALLGVTDVALIDNAIDGLAAGDGASVFATVERLVDAGHDPRRFAIDLLERLRDLILLQAVPEAVDRGLVEAPGEQLDRMRHQIGVLGPATLTRFAETTHAALGEMRGTTSPRLLLEVLCARLLLPAASSDETALLQRIEQLEAGVVTSGAAARPAAAPASAPAAAAASAPPAPTPPVTESRFMRPSERKAMEERKAAEEAERRKAEEAEADHAAQDPAVREPVAEQPVPEQAAPDQPVALAVAHDAESARSEAAEALVPPAARVDETPPWDPDPVATEDLASARQTPSSAETPSPAAEPEPEPVTEPAESVVAEPVPEPAAPSGAGREARLRLVPDPENGPDHESGTAATSADDDDVPLPEEPVDEYALPPEDAAPRSRPVRPAPEPEPEPEAEPGGLDLDAVRTRYQEFRNAVRERAKTLEPMLSAAVVHDLQDRTVVLAHPYEALVQRLGAPHAVSVMREALQEVFGTELDVRAVHQAPGSAPAAGASGGPRPAVKQQPKRTQTYSRPSAQNQVAASPAAGQPEPAADKQPPPPEPEPEPEPPRADEDIPEDEQAEMVADAHSGTPDRRHDQGAAALDLLKSELGATVIE